MLATTTVLTSMISCSNVQRFTLLDRSQLDQSKGACTTFFRGTVTHRSGRQNLTLSENFQWGVPLNPENGWKEDITLEIEEIIKGDIDRDSITLKNVGPVSLSSSSANPWPVLRAKDYYIGWRARSGEHYTNLILIPAE